MTVPRDPASVLRRPLLFAGTIVVGSSLAAMAVTRILEAGLEAGLPAAPGRPARAAAEAPRAGGAGFGDAGGGVRAPDATNVAAQLRALGAASEAARLRALAAHGEASAGTSGAVPTPLPAERGPPPRAGAVGSGEVPSHRRARLAAIQVLVAAPLAGPVRGAARAFTDAQGLGLVVREVPPGAALARRIAGHAADLLVDEARALARVPAPLTPRVVASVPLVWAASPGAPASPASPDELAAPGFRLAVPAPDHPDGREVASLLVAWGQRRSTAWQRAASACARPAPSGGGYEEALGLLARGGADACLVPASLPSESLRARLVLRPLPEAAPLTRRYAVVAWPGSPRQAGAAALADFLVSGAAGLADAWPGAGEGAGEPVAPEAGGPTAHAPSPGPRGAG